MNTNNNYIYMHMIIRKNAVLHMVIRKNAVFHKSYLQFAPI